MAKTVAGTKATVQPPFAAGELVVEPTGDRDFLENELAASLAAFRKEVEGSCIRHMEEQSLLLQRLVERCAEVTRHATTAQSLCTPGAPHPSPLKTVGSTVTTTVGSEAAVDCAQRMDSGLEYGTVHKTSTGGKTSNGNGNLRRHAYDPGRLLQSNDSSRNVNLSVRHAADSGRTLHSHDSLGDLPPQQVKAAPSSRLLQIAGTEATGSGKTQQTAFSHRGQYVKFVPRSKTLGFRTMMSLEPEKKKGIMQLMMDWVERSWCCGKMHALRVLNWWDALLRTTEPYRHGWVAKVERHFLFEAFIVTMVVLNMFVTVAETNNLSKAEEDPMTPREEYFTKVHFTFLVVYTMELGVRLWVHGIYFFLNPKHWWWWLDAVILTFAYASALYETMLLDDLHIYNPLFARSLRLLSVAKLLRLLNEVGWFLDLRYVVEFSAASLKLVFWLCFIILFFQTITAVMMVQGIVSHLEVDDLDPEDEAQLYREFGTVGRALYAIFKSTFGAVYASTNFSIIEKAGVMPQIVFFVYEIIFRLGVVNAVLPAFAVKAFFASLPQHEERMWENRCQQQVLIDEFQELIAKDVAPTERITRDEFQDLCAHESVQQFLAEHELCPQDFQILFDQLLTVEPSGTVDLATVVESFMRIRGYASSLDLISLRCQVRLAEDEIKEAVVEVSEKLERIAAFLTRDSSWAASAALKSATVEGDAFPIAPMDTSRGLQSSHGNAPEQVKAPAASDGGLPELLSML